MENQTESTPTQEPAQTEDASAPPTPNKTETYVLDGILENAIGQPGESLDDRSRSSPEPTPVGFDDPDPDPAPEEVREEGEGDGQMSETQSDDGNARESEPTSQGIDAPEHWPAEQREEFATLPRPQQEFVLRREKERDAAFTRKTQDLAEQRKAVESIEGVLSPYREQLAASGISPSEYIARLFSHDQALKQNPRGAIQALAQAYGVSSEYSDTGADWQETEPTDPQITNLQQQLIETKNRLQTFEQSAQADKHRELASVVQKFSDAKNAEGQLLYPHFEHVRERMGRLVASGETQDLEEAYNMAIRLDPELDKERMEKTRKSVEKKEDAKRKAALEKAKKANPRSHAPPPGGVVKSGDLDEILRTAVKSQIG